MKVRLVRTEGAQFRAENEAGRVTWIAGSDEIGSSTQGIRPMENVLASLAGCSAIDVIVILQRMRHTVTTLEVSLDGTRADAVPAVFTKIHVHFDVGGDFDEKKLERAVQLSMEKYCSVSKMLAPTVEITSSFAMAPTV
jgi:putative redox protein